MSLTSREIYWSAILADFRRSGLTHVEFCRLRRLSLHSFRKWLYHLRPGLPPKATRSRSQTSAVPAPQTTTTTPRFLPVHVRAQEFSQANDHEGISSATVPLERTFGATQNFLWLLDKRLRIRYV